MSIHVPLPVMISYLPFRCFMVTRVFRAYATRVLLIGSLNGGRPSLCRMQWSPSPLSQHLPVKSAGHLRDSATQGWREWQIEPCASTATLSAGSTFSFRLRCGVEFKIRQGPVNYVCSVGLVEKEDALDTAAFRSSHPTRHAPVSADMMGRMS